MLDERTLHLTKSGSKAVCIGVDPLTYNEPTVRIRGSGCAASFNMCEFQELVTELPRIMSQIRDEAERGPDDRFYRVIGVLNCYDAVLRSRRVVKFKHNSGSEPENVYLAEDTLKTLLQLGAHILEVLRQLKERDYPRFCVFTTDLAYIVMDEKLDFLTDERVYKVIEDKYNNDYLAIELYTKYHNSIVKEVSRLVDHMLTFNNYDFNEM